MPAVHALRPLPCSCDHVATDALREVMSRLENLLPS